MSLAENKELVRRRYDAANNHTPAVLDEILADDFDVHHPRLPSGREAMKQFEAMYRTAFPDAHVTIEDMIAEGGKVAVRYTERGTHLGEYRPLSLAPTGRQYARTGTAIYRIADGKLAEAWVNEDVLGMLQQLGLIPAPAPAG